MQLIRNFWAWFVSGDSDEPEKGGMRFWKASELIGGPFNSKDVRMIDLQDQI
jgi:hypothetical protein